MPGIASSMAGESGESAAIAMMHDASMFSGAKNEDVSSDIKMHSYKGSDVSSAESLAPQQGVGSRTSFRDGHGARGGSHPPADGMLTPPVDKRTGEREYLNTPEEVYYMQVFVESVGVWMDSLDRDKHFSRLIPYEALKSPMLLNALLACAVKHLTLVDPDYAEDKALYYYDTATTQLLRSLQNPDRNTAECATTAVVLNVYEIMSEKPHARMSHIAGARALIRECGWNARSRGIGAACFWLNIGMEVLSSLSFNWHTAWDPDSWGLDVDQPPDPSPGNEEAWVHRIFYVLAKIGNFRSAIPRFRQQTAHDEQMRLQARYLEWKKLKDMCDSWDATCPRSMRPYGYLQPEQARSSRFPNIW